MFSINFVPMLKRSIALLLIVCTTSANLTVLFVFAGFNLNQRYIAATLCENRNKPWLHCNGHCYLMKKIRLADENEKKQNAKDNSGCLDVIFYQQPFTISLYAPPITGITHNHLTAYTYQYTSKYIDAVFRPPKQAV